MNNILRSLLISSFGVVATLGQGVFQDLAFENAVIVPTGFGYPVNIEFAPAFPGWTGYVGAQQAMYAGHNAIAIGSAAIDLLSTNVQFGSRIAGTYTAVLQSGVQGINTVSTSLGQTGLIPAGTMSLRFLASGDVDVMNLLINGQQLSVFPLQTFNGYGEYGADVSQYAGQNAELRFVEPYVIAPRNLFLDNISFSAAPVPEPSTWALFGLGSALFWWTTRRLKR